MKNTALLISLLVLFLSACTSRNGGKLLAQADSLMQECPDSALHLLQDIPANSLKTEADRAYYALLC